MKKPTTPRPFVVPPLLTLATDAEIDAIENVCRCGTYFRIRTAIRSAAAKM